MPVNRLLLGDDCTLRRVCAAVGWAGLVIEEEGIGLGGGGDRGWVAEERGVAWLAPKVGFMRHVARNST